MPWCAGCDRFLSPSTVTPAGACPRCGASVDPGRARAPGDGPPASPTPAEPPVAAAAASADRPALSEEDADDEEPIPLPWHFKLLVGAIALYLGWRAFQGVEWVVRQL
jgi:hypothetical protein